MWYLLQERFMLLYLLLLCVGRDLVLCALLDEVFGSFHT
jgi:hypothetical protein